MGEKSRNERPLARLDAATCSTKAPVAACVRGDRPRERRWGALRALQCTWANRAIRCACECYDGGSHRPVARAKAGRAGGSEAEGIGRGEKIKGGLRGAEGKGAVLAAFGGPARRTPLLPAAVQGRKTDGCARMENRRKRATTARARETGKEGNTARPPRRRGERWSSSSRERGWGEGAVTSSGGQSGGWGNAGRVDRRAGKSPPEQGDGRVGPKRGGETRGSRSRGGKIASFRVLEERG